MSTPLLALEVTTTRAAFNPSRGETVTFTIKTTERGALTARILDRDAYVTKTLAAARPVAPGEVRLTWDGTDDAGRRVPDEAWSLHVELRGTKRHATYFPASQPTAMTGIRLDAYSPKTGILRYTLPFAARVHIQAGIKDAQSADPTAGAVMKTLVNRAPRPSGAVIEYWTGMDESGTISVPALPHFVVAIAVTPLPENAVITYGNRTITFLDAALQRTGRPLYGTGTLAAHGHHEHHQGLTTFDDVAPHLRATPRAEWDASTKTWLANSRHIQVRLALDGPTAAAFAKHPGRLVVYVDQHRVIDQKPAADVPITLDLPGDGPHVIAANWVSDYGPVAATAFRIQTIR
ncbi:MAG TPA: hypothetical protein VMS98_06570 [Thermoanaerobaculia bacterium]|nr:hypothetical protein [Thermoanaerobaculia bacterium]